RFTPGDHVYGGAFGSYSEYRTVGESGPVAPMPAGLSFESAAALPFGALTALHFLRKGGVKRGDKVLIIGASGCVGAYSTQLAAAWGAAVTAVCSGRNADFVRHQGAWEVIDYTREPTLGTGPYDAVLDAVGATSFAASKPIIRRGGVFLNVVMSTADIGAMLLPFKGGRRLVGGTSETTQPLLLELNQLVAEGAIRPLVDRTYPLEQIRDAHAYVDSKRKRGAVVVTV
ncbi:MAG TPA: NAD(P)-dependent alcohol dehydrogenase, partial [Devosia sp.]|nr:NAD(P)-dependent alcohol dehydrogenase [Devosia sp.]